MWRGKSVQRHPDATHSPPRHIIDLATLRIRLSDWFHVKACAGAARRIRGSEHPTCQRHHEWETVGNQVPRVWTVGGENAGRAGEVLIDGADPS